MHFMELTYLQDATVPVLCFLLFCVSEKLHRKYSLNWTKQKPKFLFHHNEHGVQRRDEEAPRGGLTMPRRGARSDRARGGVGPPGCPPTSPFCPYNLHIGKNLNT